MINKALGLVIKTMRMSRGLSQELLADKVGVSRSAVGMWENGKREPNLDKLEALADIFNVPLAALVTTVPAELGESTCQTVTESTVIRVPVLGTIPAGIPLEAIEDVQGWEEIPSGMGRGGKEYIGLKVSGDSMSPVYLDGDVLILRVQDTCESGQDCAVMVNGEDATFKRVRLSPSGITLQPLNPVYAPMSYTNQEVNDLPVRILGVVVELRRKI